MKLLVTGSSGLIGGEVVEQFASKGHEVFGIDNNQREVFLEKKEALAGINIDWSPNLDNFFHNEIDIRDREGIFKVLNQISPDAVVHTAAQPSHDKAASIPYDDFDTNAVGTLNLLESVRKIELKTPFIHLSTNKVYGDRPNNIKRKELDSRFEFDDPNFINGIDETLSIDQSTHSLWGFKGKLRYTCTRIW